MIEQFASFVQFTLIVVEYVLVLVFAERWLAILFEVVVDAHHVFCLEKKSVFLVESERNFVNYGFVKVRVALSEESANSFVDYADIFVVRIVRV